jgi:hypothetical protein
MPRHAALPSRRAATVSGGARMRPVQQAEPIAIVLVPPRHRPRVRTAAPALVVLEWLALTALGTIALALATG